jgi:hypothetical protein
LYAFKLLAKVRANRINRRFASDPKQICVVPEGSYRRR